MAAEDAVADFLFASGFVILWRNLRLGPLELDVVARKGPLVVVVEVRTRGAGAYEKALESIGRVKRARLKRAVERLWREHLVGLEGVERVRVDAAAVSVEGGVTRLEYVKGVVQ